MIKSRQKLKWILPLKAWDHTGSDPCSYIYSSESSVHQGFWNSNRKMQSFWMEVWAKKIQDWIFERLKNEEGNLAKENPTEWGATKSIYKLFSNSWLMPVMDLCERHYKKLRRKQQLKALKGLRNNLVAIYHQGDRTESQPVQENWHSNSRAFHRNPRRIMPQE